MQNEDKNSATEDFVKELFANAKNMIEDTLNAAHKKELISRIKGQEFMDLFCYHSDSAENFILGSNVIPEYARGFAAQAVLNMVAIALVAGSRDPHLVESKLKRLRSLGIAEAHSAARRESEQRNEIIACEYRRWLGEAANRASRTSNFAAGEILRPVNDRLETAGLTSLKQDAIRKRLDNIMNQRALDE